MATLAQVLNLSNNQLDWVCRHLGHNKSVHLQHYRCTSPFLERVQIGKILLMQDLNIQSKFVGKSLDEIDFSDIFSHAEGLGQTLPAQKEADVHLNIPDPAIPPLDGSAESQDEDPEDLEFDEDRPKSRRRTKISSRKRWSAQEMEELNKYLSANMEARVTPGRKECLRAIALSKKAGGSLQYRSYDLIVKKMSAMIQKLKKTS